jgi:hypothetical protein
VRLTKEQLIQQSKDRLQNEADRLSNALGFKIDIDTLTGIKAKVTSQKFYEVKPSDYVPIIVGEHAFSEDILTYKDYSIGGDFEAGIVQGSTNPSRTEKADAAIEGVTIPVVDWRKAVEYNLIELGKASKSGNWSLVEAKERARFKNWQLGIQKVAFLGLASRLDVDGLLTQSDVNSNTAIIPTFIKTMSTTQLGALVEGILAAYFANSNNTAMPTHFVIPTSDFLGLAAPTSETYWNGTKLAWITAMFQQLTMNPDFKILPLAYAQKAQNSDFLGSGSGLNRYVLYRYDDESLRMDIPIDYTTTITDTINGFDYQSAAYGEFTGAKAYRPLEALYFDHSV